MNDSPQLQMEFSRIDESRVEGDAVRVRVSPRSKRLSLRVYADARVEVVVPRRARPREIEAFVSRHREWIDEKRAGALRSRRPPEPFPPDVIDFPAVAERWRVHPVSAAGRLRVVELGEPGYEHRVLRIRGGVGASPAAEQRRALRAWLLRAARARLAPLVARIAASTGANYANVSIRRQRSRWGSCSTRGTISLNACLLFQRAEVVEYLIVHELMHTRHMNHSARFWGAVEQHCPDWRALDRELTQGWRHVPRWVFAEE